MASQLSAAAYFPTPSSWTSNNNPFLFHVPSPRGKTFGSSGFGLVIQSETYLFLEDVIYLKERKLITVTVPDHLITPPLPPPHTGTHLDASLPTLFSLLPKANIPLPCYLAFSHLRATSYIVLRTAPW